MPKQLAKITVIENARPGQDLIISEDGNVIYFEFVDHKPDYWKITIIKDDN